MHNPQNNKTRRTLAINTHTLQGRKMPRTLHPDERAIRMQTPKTQSRVHKEVDLPAPTDSKITKIFLVNEVDATRMAQVATEAHISPFRNKPRHVLR